MNINLTNEWISKEVLVFYVFIKFIVHYNQFVRRQCSFKKKNYLKLDENNNRKFNNFKELTDIQ